MSHLTPTTTVRPSDGKINNHTFKSLINQQMWPATKMSCSKFTLSIFLLLPLATLIVGEPQVPCLFFFGDSLVENGNNIYRRTIAKVNFLPYGIDFPEGPTGRYTNGRIVPDFLAEFLGFDKYIPPFATATTQDILGGVNYGSAGSGILDESGKEILGDVISLKEQIQNHEVAISRVAELVGSEAAAKQHLSRCIYAISTGANDYLFNYLPKYYNSTSPYTPEQFAEIIITCLSKHIQTLYDNGARKIAFFAPSRLGSLPQQVALYGGPFSYGANATNKAIHIFLENLKRLVNDLNNRHPDAKFAYLRSISDTPLFGNITNFDAPCCALDSPLEGVCARGDVPCSKRDEFLFWDGYHPTEASNFAHAKATYEDLAPLYADSDSIAIW